MSSTPRPLDELRKRSGCDRGISDAVARAAGPGLVEMVINGQRLNHPGGIRYKSADDEAVWHLIRIISEYRFLLPAGSDERRRAERVLACGHGYYLTDSCPFCGDHGDLDGYDPLIALVRSPVDVD